MARVPPPSLAYWQGMVRNWGSCPCPWVRRGRRREKERDKMVLGREEEVVSYSEAESGFSTRGYLPDGKRGRLKCFCLAAFAYWSKVKGVNMVLK